MASVKSSGTKTTDGTEQTLLDTSDAGTYYLELNTVNNANGDRIRIKATKKTLTGDTAQLIFDSVIEHAQGQPIVYWPPVYAPFGMKWTITKEAGTNRDYPWSVQSL